jgi:hypothetical protein
MPEYPIVVREVGGRNRIGVKGAADLEAGVRPVVAEASERVDVEDHDSGTQVGTVVASEDRRSVVKVRWEV